MTVLRRPAELTSEMQNSLTAAVVTRFAAMAADAFIQCRVTPATKAALHAAAQRQQLSKSALLKRLIELMLCTTTPPEQGAANPGDSPARLTHLYVRLTL